MASTATPSRKPVDSNKGLGSDMTMFYFVQPNCPTRCPSNDKQYVKGLNVETIAQVNLPAPAWILLPEYIPLRVHQDDESPGIFFSLNMSIYTQQIVPEDWTERWFFMHGRAHPYALTWEVEQLDGLELDVGDIVDYTIPSLIVRDYGYQPYDCLSNWLQ